jgi:putative membrane protein
MLWLKALHVIAVVAWFAGLFYLPRLFVYHAVAKPGSELSETFKIMERRLLRAIMLPASVVVWITGPWLAWIEGVYADGWFIAKATLVVGLTGFHHALARWRKDFANDANQHSERFYRIANEVPTLFLVAIVILVIVKPF